MNGIYRTLASVAVLAAARAAVAAPTVGDGVQCEWIKPSTNWVALGFALVAVAAIGVVGFKNARRTHMD